jgi:hypothetical protein
MGDAQTDKYRGDLVSLINPKVEGKMHRQIGRYTDGHTDTGGYTDSKIIP